jgi:hypothetical protein
MSFIQRAPRPANYPISVPAPLPRKRSLELMGLWLYLCDVRPDPDNLPPITDDEFCQQFGISKRKYLKLIKEVAADWPGLLGDIEYYFIEYNLPVPTVGPVARLAAAIKKLSS